MHLHRQKVKNTKYPDRVISGAEYLKAMHRQHPGNGPMKVIFIKNRQVAAKWFAAFVRIDAACLPAIEVSVDPELT